LVLFFLILGLKQSFGVACLITEIPQDPPLPLCLSISYVFYYVTCLDDIDLENTRGTTGGGWNKASIKPTGWIMFCFDGLAIFLLPFSGTERGINVASGWGRERAGDTHMRAFSIYQHTPFLSAFSWGAYTYNITNNHVFFFPLCSWQNTRGFCFVFVSAIMFPSRFSARVVDDDKELGRQGPCMYYIQYIVS
jgi:hypothetical protein